MVAQEQLMITSKCTVFDLMWIQGWLGLSMTTMLLGCLTLYQYYFKLSVSCVLYWDVVSSDITSTASTCSLCIVLGAQLSLISALILNGSALRMLSLCLLVVLYQLFEFDSN